jgi:hypothetical protein
MATQVATAGGTDVSFSNTPQAKDDPFTIAADTASSWTFDVLANDLGGAAKTLYSIDDGESLSTTKKYAPVDLLEKDVGDAAESVGLDGLASTIQIVDGKISFVASTAFLDLLGATAVGTYLEVKFTYAIQLGNGTLSWATATLSFEGRYVEDDNDGAPATAASALSHGYWKEHALTDSEGFADAVGNMSFDDFFNLDSPDQDYQWTDAITSAPPKPVTTITTPEDLSFESAVDFGNGGKAGDETMTPNPGENYQELVREAATAVLNFYDQTALDDDSQPFSPQDSFVEWYIYQRNLNDNDGDLTNNPTNAAGVIADLKTQVQMTLTGVDGAYGVDELADLLQLTHH